MFRNRYIQTSLENSPSHPQKTSLEDFFPIKTESYQCQDLRVVFMGDLCPNSNSNFKKPFKNQYKLHEPVFSPQTFSNPSISSHKRTVRLLALFPLVKQLKMHEKGQQQQRSPSH
jgi:hypothetical protein